MNFIASKTALPLGTNADQRIEL